MKKFSFIIILAIVQLSPLNAQEWFKDMHDPSVNFFTVQREFNMWWQQNKHEILSVEHDEDGGHEKGELWKLYKRWEQQMLPFMTTTGGLRRGNFDSVEYRMNVQRTGRHYGIESPGSSWSYIGPVQPFNEYGDLCKGRLNCVRFDPVDSNTIYVGAPSGGLWKSIDAGQTWQLLNTDNLGQIGVTDIVINPNNNQNIFIATGDYAGDASLSIGVLQSTNGGATWNTTGLSWTRSQYYTISRLLMNPLNTNIMIAATNNGIYRTTNSGVNWTEVSTITQVSGMEFRPADPNVLYACNTQLYRSTNGGVTWNVITAGLPVSTGINALALAVTPADTNCVYVLASDTGRKNVFYYPMGGLYRSLDGGTGFTLQSASADSLTTQGVYDLTLGVSPINKNIVVVGGVYTGTSNDGGLTFNGPSYYIHADQHDIRFFKGSASKVYSADDGGLFFSQDTGKTWVGLNNGLNTGQLYSNSVSYQASTYNLTGRQDNGSLLQNTTASTTVYGGDGMKCIIDPVNDSIMYYSYQDGVIEKTNNRGYNSVEIVNNAGTGVNSEGNWVTPYVLNPQNHNSIYVGKDSIYKSVDGGTTWKTLKSPAPSTGNLWNLLAIAASDSNYIYAGIYNLLVKSTNGGATFTNITSTLSNINDIVVSPTNPNKLWVATYSGVFYSTNGGNSWTNISTGLPAAANYYPECITYLKNSPDAIYVGLYYGGSVYYRDSTMSSWVQFSSALPNTSVNHLEVSYADATIRAATYGRDLWACKLYNNWYNPPVASFQFNSPNCAGGQVQFTDNSSFSPTTWLWSFPGGTPPSSNVQNPLVSYPSSGNYVVTLTAANSFGSGSVVKHITINYTVSPISACSGIYQFTDSSALNPTTRLWTFGDGATSTQQNPIHEYTSNGAYTVSLMDSNSYGIHTQTMANCLTVSKPVAPTTNNATHCTASSFSLSANTSNPVVWYDSTGNLASVGNPFNTPVLNVNTTYWAEEWIADTTANMSYHVGPPGESINGYYYNYYTSPSNILKLKFEVLVPVTLQSVLVYATYAGNQTILYADSSGNILASATVYCPVGSSRVNLNFNLAAGGPYYMGFADDSLMQFSQTGANFPYSDATGAVKITGNNFVDLYGSSYTAWYPYFYDWIVSEKPYCITERAPVTASIVPPPPPSVNNVTQCGSSAFSLSANTTNQVVWEDSTNKIVSTNNPFTTPVLPASTTYWVEQWIRDTTIIANYTAGPPGESISGGYYYYYFANANILKLKFNVSVPVTLKSVLINSSVAANRTIIYMDSVGNVLGQRTINCPLGTSTATLNFNLAAGGPYYMGFTDDSLMQFTETGASYPYSDTRGVLHITGNNLMDTYGSTYSGWYPYFYNWVISEPYCISGLTPVTATVVYMDTFRRSAAVCSGNLYNFYGNNLSASGNYYHSVTSANGCDSIIALTLTVSPPSVAGTVSPSSLSLCTGGSTSLNITGNTGNIQWQSSPNNSIFTNINGATSAAYITPSLSSTIYYRAAVTSGVCASTNSNTATLTINAVSVGGTASATSATLCSGSATSITLSGNTGTIQWQSSPDNITFTNISGATSATYATPALTTTTYYRDVVTSGVCAPANSTTATVTVNPVSVGGTASATSGTLCSGNSTLITLTGNTGIIQWQSSINNITFTNISGATSATYATPTLTTTTYYRAIVTSGVCTSANSSTATVTVNPVSVGGTTSATSGTLCSGNSTAITLTGYTGTIQWQSSSDNITFTNISGATSSTYATPALTATTYYRAIVTSGVCASANSATATVTVNPVSAGGTATPANGTLCSGNSTAITLTGYTGTIQWQSSSDNITFTNISGATSSTYVTPALTSTTYYRAVITSGVCASANSTTAIVTINPVSAGGTASATNGTLCSGNSTAITLTGYTGIIQWQSSSDNITFTNISGATSFTYTTPALTATTYYRSIVTSGVCNSANSTTATVIVNPASTGGTATPTNGILCSDNSTLITLTGNTGIIQWQSSSDNITFTNISGATSSTYATPALTATTYYRAVVTSGVCASANSTSATVTINPASVGGTAIPTNSTLCSGNSTAITLTGYTGIIQWQSSSDNITFTNISGATSATYTTPTLTSTTYYRNVVTSGVCAPANSTTATVTINPASVGGTATPTNGTLCSGNSTTITLTGSTGIIQWQASPDNITFTNISGATSATYTTPTLTTTTYYRAVITSGVCASANSTTAIVTINPVSVGGTTSATSGTLCSGNSTAITLTGNTGTIQWQSSPDNITFTNISGATSATYATPVLTATTYYRAIVTSGVCASANSTTATVTVNPVSAGGTATPAIGTLCSGNSTAITLTGNTGIIQWQSSPDNITFTNIIGATSAVYTTSALTSTTYYRAVITSGVCASANSTTAIVTINPVSAGGTASATNGTLCSGNSTAISLTGYTGIIQWQSSSDNITFANISGATSATYTTPILTATTYYRSIVTSGVCNSANSTTATVIVNPASTGGTAVATSGIICSGNSTSITVTGNAGNIQWQSSPDSITFTNISGATTSNYVTPGLTATTYYMAVVINGSCSSANSNVVTLEVDPLPINTVNLSGPATFCPGGNVILSATSGLTYLWSNGSTLQNITVSANGNYNVTVTGNNHCSAVSSPVFVTVTPLTAIQIQPANQVTCTGGNVTFGVTASGSGLTYQWRNDAGIISGAVLSTFAINNAGFADTGQYSVLVSGSCGSLISDTAELTLTPTLVISQQPVSQSVCQGEPVIFAVIANGINMAYQWQLNGHGITGATSSSYILSNASVTDTGSYVCAITSGCGNVTSNSAALHVNPISIFSYSKSICAGSGYDFISQHLTTPGIYYDTLTAANSCDSIIILTLNVLALPNPAIQANGVTTFCQGNSVILTSNTNPDWSYQWQRNGVNIPGSISNSRLVSDSTGIYAIAVTDTIGCSDTSSGIQVTINPNTVPLVSIVAGPGDSICSGTNVTFAATVTGGGSGPTYQWKVNGNHVGSNTANYSSLILNNGDVVSCVLTSNATCTTITTVNSNMVTMAVNPVITPAMNITPNPLGAICTGTNITFTANVSGGGTAPGYQWMLNGNNVGQDTGIYSSITFNNGDVVNCVLTSNALCATTTSAASNSVVISSSNHVTPAITISTPSDNVCAGSNVTVTAVDTGGGSTPSYQWKLNGNNTGSNNASFTSSTLTNGGVITCVITSSLSCALPSTGTSNNITMTVTSGVNPTISISGTDSICSGSPATFNASITNGGSAPLYQWQVNAVNAGANSNSFTTSTLTDGDAVRAILTSNATCATPAMDTSNSINMTVQSVITPTATITSSDTLICAGQPVTFTANVTGQGSAPTYLWLKNNTQYFTGVHDSTFTTNSLTGNVSVTLNVTSSLACASPQSVTSGPINITVEPLPLTPAISQSNDTLYSSSASSNQWYLNDSSIAGANGRFYLPQQNGNYHVVVTAGNCSSDTSNDIYYWKTGLQDITNWDIKIYPNPASDVLFIQSNNIVITTVEIINILGQSLSVIEVKDINYQLGVNELAPGNYILRIRSNDRLTNKIITIMRE